MKKNRVLRAAFYAAGLVILALGIVLNTKSCLGVSPIISGAYCAAELSGLSFGDMTFALYAVLAAGIILTGIGAAMSLDMRLIPNPGDGIVQALADCFKKPVGLTARSKNMHGII